jgi:GNAT superfamily N-acetyltransferase
VDARILAPERFEEAAPVMADAFLDDPGWSDVGPDDRARRHRYIRRVCSGVLTVVDRWGGPIWQVEEDGRVAGVLTTVDPGRWPPPEIRSLVRQALGPILAGPRVLWRSLVADNVMHKHHWKEPHFYIWTLTVGPAFQRKGGGRALLNAGLARADELGVPAYLETANPDNLPYYASFGFDEIGEARLPRGASIWFMHRAVP